MISRLSAALLFGLTAIAPAHAAVDCSDRSVVGGVALHDDSHNRRSGSFDNPWINRHHVFCGEINRRGKPVGFHYRQNGENPRTGPGNNNPEAARITGAIKPQEGPRGWHIYRGEEIEIWDSRRERYLLKPGFSTFFPDSCTPDQVLESIRYAVLYSRRPLPPNGGRFRGVSGPTEIDNRYCYRRESISRAERPFPISGFLNKLRDHGWTINTAYPG